MELLKNTLSYLSLFISSFFFICAVLCFNSEGTTWGAGPAMLGLFVVGPSFFVMLKFSDYRKLKLARVVLLITSFISLIIKFYTFVDTNVQLKSEHLSDGPVRFYPPNLNFQMIGILAACYLFYVVSISSKLKSADSSI